MMTIKELRNGGLLRIIAQEAYTTGETPQSILNDLVGVTQQELNKIKPPKSPSSFYKAPEVGSRSEFIVQTEEEWRRAQIMAEAKAAGIKIHPKTARYIASSNLDDGAPISSVFQSRRSKSKSKSKSILRSQLPPIGRPKKRRRVTFAQPISTFHHFKKN